VQFKVDICLRIAEGKKRAEGVSRCKIVSILVADAIFDIVDEVRLCVENEIPIIVVPGAGICDELIKISSGDDDGNGGGELRELIQKGHFFYCNSTNSEDIAQLAHLLLSITPW
jgi:hypothetical protein